MEILLFTRYPEPGKAKTRLIPALGPERAATLHRTLAERMIHLLRRTRIVTGCHFTVCHTGAPEGEFRDWLGNGISLEPQSEGDLGTRLTAAIQASLHRGHDRVIVIGADCPELDVSHFTTAFKSLANHPMVIGPAADGGYYLLGLRAPLHRELFEGIDWGTGAVLQQTHAAAQKLGFQPAQLATLHDIDLPDDLPHLERLEIPF